MQMTMFTALAGLGAGGLAAGLASPLACTWPARGQALLRRLNAVKAYRRPGPARLVAGAVLLASLLGAGALTAYAAQPSAPQQLARAMTGVVRSGGQLSLTLKEAGAAPRTLKIGEEYKDGWTLAALTPTTATLSKDGASAEVVLGSGGLAAPAAPAGLAIAAPAASASGPAAASSAMQALPKAVVGVAPGERMGLILKEDGAAPRTLRVGEEYKEGWKLTAVLSTAAVFTKGEASAQLVLREPGVDRRAPEPVGVVRDMPPSQSQIDRINNEERSARIAALQAERGGPTPAELARDAQNNATIALVTAQNRYIRASALMDQANALMRNAGTDDFDKAMQGPGAQLWADAIYQICGGGDDCTYAKLKSVVDQGPPSLSPAAARGP